MGYQATFVHIQAKTGSGKPPAYREVKERILHSMQPQDSKFVAWRSEAEHDTSRSRRLPAILNLYE